MRTRDPCANVEGFEFDGLERRHLAGRLKNDKLGSGSGARNAAERAILEMGVRSRMVVMVMMGRLAQGSRHGRCRRTQFQQERSPAGRHETCGNVRPQHQHRQQNAGQYVVSPTVERRWFHDCGPTMPDRIPGHQWENYEVRPGHARRQGTPSAHRNIEVSLVSPATSPRRGPSSASGQPARSEARLRGPASLPRTTRRNPAASSCPRYRRSVYAASLDTPGRCPER